MKSDRPGEGSPERGFFGCGDRRFANLSRSRYQSKVKSCCHPSIISPVRVSHDVIGYDIGSGSRSSSKV